MSDMTIRIYEINQNLLDDYSKISISFEVNSIYRISTLKSGLGGVAFEEVPVDAYVKEYDTYDDNPSHLMKKFDLTNWRMIVAMDDKQMVAGAILAYNTDGIRMLEGKKDLCVLWDIRVAPVYRGQEIGTKIMKVAKEWSMTNGCNRLKIETQNINVKACKFYARQGAILTGFNQHYYYDHPQEIQFIWSIYLQS